VRKFTRSGHRVRIMDVTADIGVPTFHATAFEDLGANWPFYGGGLRSAGGTGAHPDPEVAVVMALCEAAQTKIGNVAGSREDLTVKARSLGRHERTRTYPRAMRHFWLDVDAPTEALADVAGARFGDARQDVEWILARLAARGVKSVPVVDLSQDELRPARVVRVLLPGLESPNPYHCGLRARALALADLLGTPAPRQWPAHASHAARFVGRRTRASG
jgi:ribosomal protein S12 methylthiotransferase accessory factor